MQKFEQIVLIGTSRLLYQCAEVARTCYEGIAIAVFDLKPSQVEQARLRRTPSQAEIDVHTGGKQQLFAFLDACTGHTLVLSVMNPYILPAQIVQKENLCIFNLHHALLPKHRGRNAEAWAIYEGDAQGGITWHRVDAGVDTGEIFVQKSVPIDETTTSLALLRTSHALALEGLRELLPLECFTAKPQIQAHLQGDVHLSSDVPNGGRFDFSWTPEQMVRFLNAMNYGTLYLMGKPFFMHEGRMYQFGKWKFERVQAPASAPKLEDGTLSFQNGPLHFEFWMLNEMV